VPKGFGRIIRDATGNVIDVELGEEKAEPVTEEGDAMVRGQQIQTWSGQGTRHSESTELVKSRMTKALLRSCYEILTARSFRLDLETLASRIVKHPRLASSGEKAWLKEVVAKYGDNYEAAARDRKINPWQRTAGEIRRSYVRST
jgi:nucleolar protein 16